MSQGRMPGFYGRSGVCGCVYNPGPLGGWDEGEFGHRPHFTPGVLGCGMDIAVRQALPEVPAADEQELKLLIQVYGTLLDRAGTLSYSYRVKKQTRYRVKEYVAHRDTFIGAGKAYIDYLAKCKAELDADGEKLRKYVEPAVQVRKRVADWRKAQDVFYAWVRKGYEKALGSDVDVGKLIKAQMSDKLKTALDQVKHDFGKGFQYGGFNPRPMKKHGYRLGTISEHALGSAIDIESENNPQLLAKEWKAILAFAGKTAVDHSSATWKTSPKTVWTNVKAVNDAWASALEKAMKEAEAQAKKVAEEAAKATPPGSKPKPAPAAIDLAFAEHADLKTLGKSFVQKYGKGFFTLPWELVKELHEVGFLWGATFQDLDLHHFEL